MKGKDLLKGQSAIEFLIYISITLLILTILTGSISNKNQETQEFQEIKNAEKVADLISKELETAMIAGNGYSRNVTVPNNINGREYNVSQFNNNIIIELVGKNTTYSSPTKFSGQITINSEIATTYRIQNNQNEVEVESIEN